MVRKFGTFWTTGWILNVLWCSNFKKENMQVLIVLKNVHWNINDWWNKKIFKLVSSIASLSLIRDYQKLCSNSLFFSPLQTYTGSILVSVNPYKMFDIYGLEMVKKYEGQILGTLPPWVELFLLCQHPGTRYVGFWIETSGVFNSGTSVFWNSDVKNFEANVSVIVSEFIT